MLFKKKKQVILLRSWLKFTRDFGEVRTASLARHVKIHLNLATFLAFERSCT